MLMQAAKSLSPSAASDSGHDADLIAIGQGRGLVVEEADVFAVDIYVEKTPQFAFFITETAMDTWKAGIEGLQQGINAAGINADTGFIVGELLQGRGDQNLDGHGGIGGG